MQSQGPRHTAHCKRKLSHPPAYSRIKSPLESVVKPSSQEGSMPSVLSTESTLSSSISQAHTAEPRLRAAPDWEILSSWSPHIPSFSSPTTLYFCQHNCLWLRGKSNWASEIARFIKRKINHTALFGTLPFAWRILSLRVTPWWHSRGIKNSRGKQGDPHNQKVPGEVLNRTHHHVDLS